MTEFSFLELLTLRLLKNYSNIIVFVGKTGVGKSYSAITLANALDPDFSVNKIFFDLKELMEYLLDCKKGEAILLEEAGVLCGHRDFMELTNKVFSYVTQTMRFKCINLLITLPNFYMLDKVARTLTNFLVYCHTREQNYVQATIYKIKNNPLYGQNYLESLCEFKFYLNPSLKPLFCEYEKKKSEFFDSLLKKSIKKLEEIEQK